MGSGQQSIVVAHYSSVNTMSRFDVGTAGGHNVQLERFHAMGGVGVRREQHPKWRTPRDR